MKKLLFSLLTVILMSSCGTTKLTHLIGTYDINTSTETDKTFDEVWDRVIDYFAVTGIPIVTLEKSSGLIVSNQVSLKEMVTMEENGKPKNGSAYIVIPYAKNTTFMDATSDFNVRVKERNGKVVVSVNLPNISARRTIKPKGLQMMSFPDLVQAKSTGVFEKGLLDLFK